MRLRFWCNHCGKFDAGVNFELDEIGAYTIPMKYCPECMYALKHEVVEGIVPKTEPDETSKRAFEITKSVTRPPVTVDNEQTANDNKADVEGTIS